MKTLLFGNGAVSLDAVSPYQNIDLAPEAAFDDLTRLAACVCQTPVALLCLIDAKHWRLKSQVGLEQESTESYLALCAEAMLNPERWDSRLLIVENTSVDRRFATHELVTLQKVKFYAGVPLITPQGLILGILSVIDHVPRSLSLQQQEGLAALSRQAIAQLELRKNLTERQEARSKDSQSKQKLQASYKELADVKWALDRFSMVAITDHKGKINYVNDKFCEISKYSRDELLGQNHRIVNSGYHSADFFKQMWATISSGKNWKGEIKNQAKDGSFYWVETAIVPILNTQGKPYEYVSICQDITERKRSEEQRLSVDTAISNSLAGQGSTQCLPGDSQMRFFMLSPDLMCVTGFDGYLKRVNPAFEKTLQYTPEELLSKPFLDFVHPEDQAATQAELDKLANSAQSIQFENRYRCQDGSYKWLAWSAFGVVEENSVYAIARDITKTKQQKATLLKRSRLSTLEADVGAALVDKSGTLHLNLKRCTESMVQHLDALSAGIWTVDPAVVESNELLPLNLQASAGQLVPTEPLSESWQELIQSVAQTQQSLTNPVLTQVENVGNTPANGETFLIGYPLIIESRLVGVMALHSQQSFSKIVHGVLRWVANAIATAIDHSWTREELLNRREALLFHLSSQIRNSLDLDTILDTAVTEIRNLLGVDCCQFLWHLSESGQLSLQITHEARNPKLPSLLGECRPPNLTPLIETISSLQTIQIDNLAEATGLESETRSLFTDWGITAGLVLPFKTHTGQLAAIVCSHYDGARAWSDREVELLQAVVNQLAIAIEQVDLFASTRAAIMAAQTQTRHLDLALRDLKQTESRLIQAEKMSSLGQMVAGIAHEINNPVSFITGNLCHATNYIQDLLDLIDRYQQHYPEPVPGIQQLIDEIDLEFLVEDLPKVLASMQMGADRICEIVLSLRNFSRTDEAEMQPTNIHEGIDNTLLILHNRLKASGHKPGISIIKEYGDLPLVECYAGQLNQVFMNIISNAIDALESNRGEELSPEHPVAPLPTIWIRTEVTDDNQAVIRIRDNGPGISQSVIKCLFDPFFTTKPVGKGTGLGLSISYQIVVEKHGGVLKCLSAPGQGAEFWIQIPITTLTGEGR
jgi:two-component system, NtrC family, sensor kinase